MDPVLTDRQVAELLQVPVLNIQRLSTTTPKAGRLTGFKVGRFWRYFESDVERFAKANIDASLAPVVQLPPHVAGIHPSSRAKVRRRAS